MLARHLTLGRRCAMPVCAALVSACMCAGIASAAPFGSQLIVGNVKVQTIFRGAYGPVYVTFTPSSLTGCNGNYGGYLSSMWSEAITWTPDPAAGKDQLALLMLAKSTDAVVEVRYRVNQAGTGWDKCAIDAIWVQ
jgi:hypothetical protein